MKTFFYNIGYFFLEAIRTIKFNLLSNLISIIGTGLILFLLGLVLTGWQIGDYLLDALQDQAEVSAYFTEETTKEEAERLIVAVKNIEGVVDAFYIDETKAHDRMEELLGEEAKILELFEENPFKAFLDIRISLEDMDQVLTKVKKLQGISYVRDNRQVLEQMKNIISGIELVGALVAIAVGITTLIIISHMIRQGIYNNKEQIHTLHLLGAPKAFIGFPFVLAGILLTFLGGVLSTTLLHLLLDNGYSRLGGFMPFIPMPSVTVIKDTVSLVILSAGAALGLIGSLFGVASIRKENN